MGGRLLQTKTRTNVLPNALDPKIELALSAYLVPIPRYAKWTGAGAPQIYLFFP